MSERILNDPAAMMAIETLKGGGYSADDVCRVMADMDGRGEPSGVVCGKDHPDYETRGPKNPPEDDGTAYPTQPPTTGERGKDLCARCGKRDGVCVCPAFDGERK